MHILVVLLCAALCVAVEQSVCEAPSHRREPIDDSENAVLQLLYGDILLNRWVNVSVGDEIWEAHYLISSDFASDKPTVVLLHGYGATSILTWKYIIPQLHKDYNIVAIDMPGFGRSPAPTSLLVASTPDAHHLYCSFYESIFTILHLKSPFVVAHSFGGFVFVNCAARNSSLASGLLLATVPGFFPSNGGWDFAWSSYFHMGLPHHPLRWLRSYAFSIYDTILGFLRISVPQDIIRYWHLSQVNPDTKSELIMQKFIHHTGIYSIGRGLALVPFLNLTIPVTIAYGSEDFIVPAHQGELLSTMTGVRSHVVHGAGHRIYAHNKGADFTQVRGIHYYYV